MDASRRRVRSLISRTFGTQLPQVTTTIILQTTIFLALTGFAFWNRIRNYERLITPSGDVIFPSIDAWYHRRATHYTVEHYPFTIPFDPFTAFPTGNYAGQFGTVFDQFLATVALVIGGGNPSPATIDAVLLFAPPVLGVLTILPIYLTTDAISDSWGGLIATLVVAISPGLFLSRSIAGFADHHVAETLLVATSLYLFSNALTAAYTSEPPLAGLRQQDYSQFWSRIGWSAAAGITVAGYLLTWPPGVFFVATLALFFSLRVVLDYLHNRNPRRLMLPAVVSMGISSLCILPFLHTTSLTATGVSPLQVSLPALTGLGTLGISDLAYRWQHSQRGKLEFLAVLGGMGVLSAGVFWMMFPDTAWYFIRKSEYVIWFVDIGTKPAIAEATSIQNPLRFGFVTYGFALLTAIGGWGFILREVVRGRDNTGMLTLIGVFAAVITSATLSQIRFDYYLIIAVAVLSGYAVSQTYSRLERRWTQNGVGDADIRAKIVAVAVVVFLVVPFALSGTTLIAATSYTGSSGDSGWSQTFDWMQNETPAVGSYGTGEPPRLNYTGRYAYTEDFEYQQGEYGVMTRWALGHQLTVDAHRIPVSNPHQQHATKVANILLASDEATALERMNQSFGEGSGIRYAILDDEWGSGNSQIFTNPVSFEAAQNLSKDNLLTNVVQPDTGTSITLLQSARSYQSLRTRLYQFHGSAVQASNLVVSYNSTSGVEGVVPPMDTPLVREFESAEAAAAAAAESPTAIQGGLYGESGNRVAALEHFRLVYATPQLANVSSPSLVNRSAVVHEKRVSEVKTFERVPGATITGTAPANATVKASVSLLITTTGKTFTYTQYATVADNGTYTLTVPYATTGYDEYTLADGFTNSSVRARGPYSVVVHNTTTGDVLSQQNVSVPEGVVLGEESGIVLDERD